MTGQPAEPRARLGHHSYGKTGVRLAKVERDGDLHTFHDLTVRLWLEGDFGPAFLAGDNSTSLPTDTMRATTYAFARDLPLAQTEVFLEAVGRRLLEVVPAATTAHLDATVHSWERIPVDGQGHPHAFRGVMGDGTAEVALTREEAATVTSGLTGLLVAKTAHSEYAGFLTDDYTVLAETNDRIMATSVDTTWTWLRPPASYPLAREVVRRTLERVFATHHSLAVQHTLFASGEAVLTAVPEIATITVVMPNRHHVPVDLTPFGRDNPNEVFVVPDRPYGVISATVERT